MEIQNLLKQIKDTLVLYGKSGADVEWVGSSDGKYALSWDEFKIIGDMEYEAGYVIGLIASDLVVVGSDWWLERDWIEEDTMDWVFKTLLIRKTETRLFTQVIGNFSYKRLAVINGDKEDEED